MLLVLMLAISTWCGLLLMSNIGSGFKWAPPVDSGAKLKFDPHSNLALLNDLAAWLISLAEEAHRTGSGDLENGGDSGYGTSSQGTLPMDDLIKEVRNEAIIYL
jgi:hypothetical protein